MRPILLVHGGAGAMPSMTSEREGRYRTGLRASCAAGASVLQAGGSALDSVIAATVAMEDSGVFNAGLGSCLTTAGTIEMDAAVMRGADRGFGAVAGITQVANPVTVARAVMDKTPHCILGGEGAVRFARDLGFAFREDFPSAARILDWEKRRQRLGDSISEESLAALGGVLGEAPSGPEDPIGSRDTVGAVAIDSDGSVAAAVSTGGIWMKLSGRIGDSPLPGSGLWAVDGLGAAVATGTGESILRVLLCKEVVDRMNAGSAQEASEAGIALLQEQFGSNVGGVVSIGANGTFGFGLNTRGMGRAIWRPGMAEPATGVWSSDPWDRDLSD